MKVTPITRVKIKLRRPHKQKDFFAARQVVNPVMIKKIPMIKNPTKK